MDQTPASAWVDASHRDLQRSPRRHPSPAVAPAKASRCNVQATQCGYDAAVPRTGLPTRSRAMTCSGNRQERDGMRNTHAPSDAPPSCKARSPSSIDADTSPHRRCHGPLANAPSAPSQVDPGRQRAHRPAASSKSLAAASLLAAQAPRRNHRLAPAPSSRRGRKPANASNPSSAMAAPTQRGR